MMDQYWRGCSSFSLCVFMVLALFYGGIMLAFSPLTPVKSDDRIPMY